MTTPFSVKAPLIIDLMGVYKGQTSIITAPTAVSIGGTTSTILEVGTVLDWSKIDGAFAFNVVFGHVATSTAGNQICKLVDITNSSTILATTSSNVSTANSNFNIAIGTTITFSKPSGVAKVGVIFDNRDTTARNFSLWHAAILVT